MIRGSFINVFNPQYSRGIGSRNPSGYQNLWVLKSFVQNGTVFAYILSYTLNHLQMTYKEAASAS
jgi:hypothetical protein